MWIDFNESVRTQLVTSYANPMTDHIFEFHEDGTNEIIGAASEPIFAQYLLNTNVGLAESRQ